VQALSSQYLITYYEFTVELPEQSTQIYMRGTRKEILLYLKPSPKPCDQLHTTSWVAFTVIALASHVIKSQHSKVAKVRTLKVRVTYRPFPGTQSEDVHFMSKNNHLLHWALITTCTQPSIQHLYSWFHAHSFYSSCKSEHLAASLKTISIILSAEDNVLIFPYSNAV
jgi:hypothetical protein